jgi:very-short-patch-repair endonuclease
VVHQSTDLLPEHVQEVDELTVTTPARTIVDLAMVLGPQRLERAVEHALVTGTVDVDELIDLVAALSRRGKRGTKALRTIVDEKVRGVAVTDTQLERLLFRLIDDADLPRPTRQFSAPWLKSLNGRVDFAYERERIVIEADSRRWHLLFDAFEVDKIRDNAAQLAGWIVIRVTWRMIKEQPSQVVLTIREALGLRRDHIHSRDE